MSKKIVFVFVFASYLAMILADAAASNKIQPQPVPKANTTAPPETTTPSTTTPTTTTPSTTTPSTTTPSTTTTIPTTPTTTTVSPNTTTPSTTTSTTTATPSTPTTTAPPAPKPTDIGNWTVTNKADDVTCIIAQMAIQLNVTYLQKDNKTGHSIIKVPAATTIATGDCGNLTQTLVLSWAAVGVAKPHQITLTFGRNDTTKVTKVERIDAALQANGTEFPNIKNFTVLTLVNEQAEFATDLGMSYHCAKNQMVDLTVKGSNVTVAVITVNHLQLESFHANNGTTFSTAKDCESSSATDIVPIAVGCALVTLVAIVLIAYLVGRRRSQARGYLSITTLNLQHYTTKFLYIEMKPTIVADEMFPEGAGPYMDLEEAGGSSGLLMDLAANEKAVHADFFNAFDDLYDDEDLN